jgi:hypothetical protein
MEKLQPEFKFLESCQPGELLRLNLGEQTQWALTGQSGNGLFPVIVLTGCTSLHKCDLTPMVDDENLP